MSVGEGPVVRTASARDRKISVVVPETIADVEGRDPVEVPLLSEDVDGDALETLFAPENSAGRVAFDYAGYLVVVHSDRTVEVRERTDGP